MIIMTEAQERLRRLLQILALGGHVREDVLRDAEQAVQRMDTNAQAA